MFSSGKGIGGRAPYCRSYGAHHEGGKENFRHLGRPPAGRPYRQEDLVECFLIIVSMSL
jgi:hypothetical protein